MSKNFYTALKALMVSIICWCLFAVLATGCAQAPTVKPDQPPPAQPAKDDKTFMDTFIQFFEPRD